MVRSPLLGDWPHGFTGVAEGDWRWERPDAGEVRRVSLGDAAGGRVVELRQVHGAACVEARAVPAEGASGDALLTDERAVAVAVRVADCVPVLLAGGAWVAAVHAGWRGTAAGIVRVAVERLRSLGAGPLRAAIGPAICGDCYEVSPEVVEAVGRAAPGRAWLLGDRHVDLRRANQAALAALDVPAELVGGCTRCTPGYWSHRRDGEGAGRQAAWIRRP